MFSATSCFKVFVSLCGLLMSQPVRAVELKKAKLATIDFPPMAIHGKRSQAQGIGSDIGRELAKMTGLELQDYFIEIKDMVQVAASETALFSMVTKIPSREKSFQWIGKYLDDHYCFVTLKGKPTVSTMEDAKKLKSVGVNQGGATEASLKKNGFTNLNGALGAVGSLRKLRAGVIDAWYASELVAKHTLRAEGLDPTTSACSGSFESVEYWNAVSLDMPPAKIAQLKTAFGELEKNGFIKKSIAKYD